jgi:hypothetical protein
MRSVPPRSSLYCAAFLILALSSVGLLWRGPADNIGSAAYATAEYRKEARTLKLAPGRHWPVSPFPSDFHSGKGAGTMQADEYWFCSWAQQALDPKLQRAARRQALAQLPKLRRTYSWQHYLPDTRAAKNTIISKALRRNTSELRANCSWLGQAHG